MNELIREIQDGLPDMHLEIIDRDGGSYPLKVLIYDGKWAIIAYLSKVMVGRGKDIARCIRDAFDRARV